MTDPLSMLGGADGVRGPGAAGPLPFDRARGAGEANGRVFEQEFLSEVARQIDEVNKLSTDADLATEDLSTGRRSDVEGVMIATQKADTAFRMLLAVRNRMMEAYEEVKQIRI